MNISRDRMSRPIDISTMLESAERRVDLVVDEPGLQWKGLSTQNVSTATHSCGDGGGGSGGGGNVDRRKVGLRRIRRCRGVNRSLVGKENQRPKNLRKGQGSRGSVLPSWYPRTPLRDITAIVRAIERKRAELYNHQTTRASQQETGGLEAPNTQLDDEMRTSKPLSKPCKVIKDGEADKKGKDVDLFSPPKKLLDSIDKVRQIWLEDQRKQEKTPSKKKAERQKMVRVLMSMR